MRRGILIAILGLAGCDKLLGLSPVEPPFAPAAGAATLAAGAGHTCWLDSQGAIWCWGENDVGETGAGATQPELDSLAPIDDHRYLAVSAKHQHTCAIRDDHTLWCWGATADGRLGLGTAIPDSYDAPVQVGTATWKTVAAGTYHTCAIDTGNALWCWGYDADGELGDGGASDHEYEPVEVGSDYAAVATGRFHTCAIRLDGTLACWGSNGHGQLGDATLQDHATPMPVGAETWKAIAAGRDHSCGVTASGHLRCWGHNHAGQLGGPALADVESPMPVLVGGTDGNDWTGVAANSYHTCAWTSAGDAFCFGDSSHGELGNADAVNMTPLAIEGTWTAFALGETHVCAVDRARGLSCAGGNGWGQLGQGSTAVLAPQQVGSATWDKVYAGDHATCALLGGQAASCGGNNFYGQLGDNTQTSRSTLAPVAGGHGWTQLALGTSHVCAVESSSPPAVWCWGRNDNGESAHSFSGPFAQPTITTVVGPSPTATIQVSASDHTCAAVEDSPSFGRTYCWGNNDHGQLGDGSTTARSSPVVLTNPANGTFSLLAAGDGFTCGHLTDGELFCWGRGDNGLNPTHADATTLQAEPQPITSSQVFAGGNHACMIDNQSAHRAYCWGYNGEGQLGFPTPMAVDTPTLASTQSWDTLALGAVHTCGIESVTHHLYCWGDNRRGQIGNGDRLRGSVTAPTLVTGDQWQSVAAGAFHTCAVDTASRLFCWGSDDDGALLDGGGWQAQMVSVSVPP